MSWNYRLISHSDKEESWVSVHEVYYKADGSLAGWVEQPAPVLADEVSGLNWVLSKMLEATTKPVLKASDFKASICLDVSKDLGVCLKAAGHTGPHKHEQVQAAPAR